MRFWLITPLALLSLGFSAQTLVWQALSSTGHLNNIDRMAAHPQKSNIIFFTSSGSLYKTDLATGQTLLLFTFPQSDSRVHDITIEADRIYAVTDANVYAISEGGGGEFVFQSSAYERPCLSVAVKDETIYVGTSRGVRYRFPHTSSWKTLSGPFENQPVVSLRAASPFLYIGAGQSVIRWDSLNKQFKTVLTQVSAHRDDLPAQSDTEAVDYDLASAPAFLGLDLDGPNAIVALNSSGVWQSSDLGEHWANASGGSALNAVHSVRVVHLKDQSYLMAATGQGAFYLSDGRWQSLRSGMETTDVRDIAQTSDGTILAATDRGIFILSERQALSKNDRNESVRVSEEVEREPSVQDVQDMAIVYAEVHPDKIRAWRKLSRRRAIFPHVSVGLDRNSSEFLHWDSGANPDQLLHGKALVDWDVSLSWDLGDLIWSSDQTSIDSRSKLMVELRDDILNQVTRIYFERKRLQVQLEQITDDEMLQLDTDLKVQELTALLDSFTGGGFSAAVAAGRE